MSDISAIPATSTTAAAGAPAPSPPSPVHELGADTFLQLLVAQLKYQDPTAPSDGTEFLAQTAQFTMVEKLTELAERAEANEVVNRNLGAASMVGDRITWLRGDGSTGEGIVAAARLGSAGPVLVVDGEDVAFDQVSAVVRTDPPPAPASSTEAADDETDPDASAPAPGAPAPDPATEPTTTGPTTAV